MLILASFLLEFYGQANELFGCFGPLYSICLVLGWSVGCDCLFGRYLLDVFARCAVRCNEKKHDALFIF